jgi:hypothetical protein
MRIVDVIEYYTLYQIYRLQYDMLTRRDSLLSAPPLLNLRLSLLQRLIECLYVGPHGRTKHCSPHHTNQGGGVSWGAMLQPVLTSTTHQ